MKTKLSRAILLASVALLSVVGATMSFSSNRSLNHQLMASDVEAMANFEGFLDTPPREWWNRLDWKRDVMYTPITATYGIPPFTVSETITVKEVFYCVDMAPGHGEFAHCIDGYCW